MRKLKDNYLLIIVFTLLLIVLGANYFSYLKKVENWQDSDREIREECLQHQENNSYSSTEHQKFCQELSTKTFNKPDFFTIFTEVIVYNFNKIGVIIPLLIMIPTIWYVTRYLRSKMVINELTRESYHKILKKLALYAYKSSLILPLIIVVGSILIILYTKDFNFDYAILNSSTGWSQDVMSRPILFLVLYILNVLFHCVIYINIALIVIRKNHNFFIAAFLSFLTYIGIELFQEVFMENILLYIVFKSNIGVVFNILNIFSFNDSYGLLIIIFSSFIMMLISFLIVCLAYKNKEKMVIDCERNE